MLHQFLWSLIRQEYSSWDLIIVDDSDVPVPWNRLGVYPRLFNEMSRSDHDIQVVQGPRVGRIGAAYQAGFCSSSLKNQLFFRADDDSWLEPDYFSRLVQFMEDRSVGACGGLFLHPGEEIETLSFDDKRYAHARIEHLSDHINIQWFRHERQSPIPVEHLTADILFNRVWLERIGGFEPQLYCQHRDETQATWRLFLEGAQLLVDPRAVAWHLRAVNGGARNQTPDVFLNDHRTFMAQRKTMQPGIHVHLGHGIGDTLMATPMLEMMRRMNPHRKIAVFAPHATEILGGNPCVDDIAIHALDAQRTVRLQDSVYEWASVNNWDGHLAQAYSRMFDLPEPEDTTPIMPRKEENIREARIRDYVLIAPWSNAKTYDLFKVSGNKNWPFEYWNTVIDWAHGKGLSVVQVRESADEPSIQGVDLDVCGRSLEEALQWILNATLVISVDTMAHHVAASAAIPSVTLWGRSKPQHFGYDKPHIVNIQGECPGGPTILSFKGNRTATEVIDRPCINGNQWSMDMCECPLPGHPCMSSISPEQVIAACESLIGGGFVNVPQDLRT
jgi:ADP-heptose:LPS heptosyltransferase/GT2 family glycosyltransferase